ncbi:Dynamin [Drechslerella dactyloides]|uniref:Dynamin n=1 Tax=Drechslerella dactyloides TaxID=74499 RepID=A0AAD6ITH7_DREDA|nr:Dynamin [Drechslerella dactyloides]
MSAMSLVSSSEKANKSKSFLQKVAELRAHGVGDHISLPQLVVCGDQSAGKSSVLEGITGIPFPRNDGVCTKFATEITLTHNDGGETTIKATIIPHASRSEEEKARISSSNWTLPNFGELPSVISQVGEIMGLRGFGRNATGPAFGLDVLSIKVSGPTERHLTVVDLPGLIAVSNDEQTDEDVRIPERLVDQYIRSSRTIIIAIVQAGNDIANQKIIQKAREVDANGERTVGVITKPDLINKGTEKRIAMLSRNEDTTKLKRGFFIVKNPAPHDLEAGDMDSEARRRMEDAFFTSPPWSEQRLDKERVGTPRLTSYLQSILDRHIERELPKVYAEIRQLLSQTEEELLSLGPERKTHTEMKAYLAEVSLQFHDLCRQSLDGHYAKYGDTFFEDEELRLRAQVHKFNNRFARNMLHRGAKWGCLVKLDEESHPDDDAPVEVVEGEDSKDSDPIQEARAWIIKTYRRTRGQELQGTYNSVLLAELFHEQSSPWLDIAREHLHTVFRSASRFIRQALAFIVKDEQVLRRLHPEVQDILDKSHREAKLELTQLWKDERRFPMTYNSYYADVVRQARSEDNQSTLSTAVTDSNLDPEDISEENDKKTWVHLEALKTALAAIPITVDIEIQACKEANTALKAYYEIALKTFVDNVCRQVIERHILTDLSDIFSPVSVMQFSAEKVEHLGSESDEVQRKRQELEGLRAQLESGISVLM